MTATLRNQYFSLALPSGWIDTSEADAVAFASPTTREELVVGLHTFIRPLNEAELIGVTWDLVQHKAKACGQLSEGTLEILEAVQPAAKAKEIRGSFSALDKRNQVYCRTEVIGRSTFAVSFSYYKHSCPAANQEIESAAQRVLNECHVTIDA